MTRNLLIQRVLGNSSQIGPEIRPLLQNGFWIVAKSSRRLSRNRSVPVSRHADWDVESACHLKIPVAYAVFHS
jgi:hypothetical protein